MSLVVYLVVVENLNIFGVGERSHGVGSETLYPTYSFVSFTGIFNGTTYVGFVIEGLR